jgi:hypothetical protein
LKALEEAEVAEVTEKVAAAAGAAEVVKKVAEAEAFAALLQPQVSELDF